jgi:hypothetical protein
MLAEMREGRLRRITRGPGKAYNNKDFVITVRELSVTPRAAKTDGRRMSNLSPEPRARPAGPSA